MQKFRGLARVYDNVCGGCSWFVPTWVLRDLDQPCIGASNRCAGSTLQPCLRNQTDVNGSHNQHGTMQAQRLEIRERNLGTESFNSPFRALSRVRESGSQSCPSPDTMWNITTRYIPNPNRWNLEPNPNLKPRVQVPVSVRGLCCRNCDATSCLRCVKRLPWQTCWDPRSGASCTGILCKLRLECLLLQDLMRDGSKCSA